jgi:4a-hydroxytetrahydrobiopterin dehydratase
MSGVSAGAAGWVAPRQFHETEGLRDWRLVAGGAGAHFRTGSLVAGARLVQAIAEAGDREGLRPDVDLRPEGVTVRLPLLQPLDHGVSGGDVELARQISAAARELGLDADPSVVQTLQVSIDALDRPRVSRFWRALLGGYVDRDGPEDLVDPRRRLPAFFFQQMDAPRPQRNRIHIDVWVPYDQAEARVAAAIAAGGHLVTDENAPSWWVLADAEGNEACVTTLGWCGPEPRTQAGRTGD